MSNELDYKNIFERASDGLIVHDVETGRLVEANPAAGVMHGYARKAFIGLRATAFIHPENHSLFDEYVQATRSGDAFQPLMVHVRRDGSLFYVEWSGTAFTYQGRACLLSIVRDVSERVQAERLLEQRVEAHTRERSILLEISQTLASALELQPALILDQLRVIIEYTHAGLFALEDSALVALAVRGPQHLERAVPFHVRLNGPGTLETLFNGHRPIRIADVWADDPAAQFLRSLLDDPTAVLLEGVCSWMWVPLAVEGRVIGGVGIAHAEQNYFTAHHADLAMTVANQAAIAMVNAELYERAQTLAALHERQRLAQNLHDAVNQSLFTAGLIAEILPRLWERDQDEARRSLESLRRLTHGALAEMRALLAELRPSILTETDLGDLLRQLGSAFTGRTNIPVAVTVAGQDSLSTEGQLVLPTKVQVGLPTKVQVGLPIEVQVVLPTKVQVAFYRVCQEGLNNIAKHAKADQVALHLRSDPGAVELRLCDNGRGFDPAHVSPGRSGLSMMRERAQAVGATLSIKSQPGQGAEITIRWTKGPTQEA